MPRASAARAGAALALVAALIGATPLAANAADGPAPSPTTTPSPTATPKDGSTAKNRDASRSEAPAKRTDDSKSDDAAKSKNGSKGKDAPRTKDAGTPSDADRQAVQDLSERILALQTASDAKGEVAQKTNERYLKVKAKADSARAALHDAQVAARAASIAAAESRERAGAVAARLSRTDLGTLPLDLMLNHASADRVLGGLSSAGQLSTQATLVYKKAQQDQATAERMQSASEHRDQQAATAARKAASARAKAQKDATAAKRAVQQAQAEEATLLQRIGDTDATAVVDLCGQLEAAPDGCGPAETPTPPGGASSGGGSIGDRVVAFARAQIGDPYVFAAAGPSSWDCSGLTLGAWQSVGVTIGIHSATAQYRTARDAGELVSVSDAEPGDLLFYTDGGGDMYHITIYAGGGDMIEAPYPGATVREVPVRTGDLLGQAAHIR